MPSRRYLISVLTRSLLAAACLFLTIVSSHAQVPSSTRSSMDNHARVRTARIDLASSSAAVALDMHDKVTLYDVSYYGLDLTLSTGTSAIRGNCTMKATAGGVAIDTLVIALINTIGTATMVTDSVFVDGANRAFIHTGHVIQIPMSPPLATGSSFTSRVYYHGNDSTVGVGLLRKVKYGTPILFTNAIPYYPNFWFPCKDMLEDWADSVDIAITTESVNKVAATGALVRTTPTGNGRTRWEFSSRWPIPAMNINLAVGAYQEYRTSMFLPAVSDSVVFRGLLLPGSPNLAKQIAAIEQAKQFLSYFSEIFGPPPFWKNEFRYTVCSWTSSAMNTQNFSLWADTRLDTTIVNGGTYLAWFVPHELSHSWFDGTVGTLTENDNWLSEGMATYCEQLAMEHFLSDSVARLNNRLNQQYVMTQPGGSVYIPGDLRYDAARVFDVRLTYTKGSVIAHTLRFEIGSDSLFFRIMKDYMTEFAGKGITGEMFRDFLERKTGKDFHRFFDQWYYGEGYPTFNVACRNQPGGVRIIVAETTSTSVTTLFRTPLELKLWSRGVDTTILVFQNAIVDTFLVSTDREIDALQVDPNGWLLCKTGLVVITGVSDEGADVPREFAVEQNYPNPFNPETGIRYQVSVTSEVDLRVYDLLGREVAVLVNEEKMPGTYTTTWNASGCASGVYFYTLHTGEFRETRRMILVR